MEMSKYVVTVNRDSQDQWRWRASRKGRVIFVASEGYHRAASCLNSLESAAKDLFKFDSYRVKFSTPKVQAASEKHIRQHCPALSVALKLALLPDSRD